MGQMCRYVVELHQNGDWAALLQFYGPILAFILLIVLLWLHSRSRSVADKTAGRVAELGDQIASLRTALDRVADNVSAELESQLTKKINKNLDDMGSRVQDLHAKNNDLLEQRASELASKMAQVEADVGAMRRHLDEVQTGMPRFLDKLDEFEGTLAKNYKAELSSVLGSFDNVVGRVLDQMKNEMQASLSRIESIEGMVRNRRHAEPPDEDEIVPPVPQQDQGEADEELDHVLVAAREPRDESDAPGRTDHSEVEGPAEEEE